MPRKSWGKEQGKNEISVDRPGWRGGGLGLKQGTFGGDLGPALWDRRLTTGIAVSGPGFVITRIGALLGFCSLYWPLGCIYTSSSLALNAARRSLRISALLACHLQDVPSCGRMRLLTCLLDPQIRAVGTLSRCPSRGLPLCVYLPSCTVFTLLLPNPAWRRRRILKDKKDWSSASLSYESALTVCVVRHGPSVGAAAHQRNHVSVY